MIINPLIPLKMIANELLVTETQSLAEQILQHQQYSHSSEDVHNSASLSSEEVLEKMKTFTMQEILKEEIFFPSLSDEDEELASVTW